MALIEFLNEYNDSTTTNASAAEQTRIYDTLWPSIPAKGATGVEIINTISIIERLVDAP